MYAHLTEFAIPVCLGDYFGRFRVVATNTDLFDTLVYDIENRRSSSSPRDATSSRQQGARLFRGGRRLAVARELKM